MNGGALEAVRVVITRESRGRLAELLEAEGAEVLHLPLIACVDAADGGAALTEALTSLPRDAWVAVTSANGAERIGLLANRPDVRVAAVGTRTAAVVNEVVGRPPTLISERQTAADLAELMARELVPPADVVVALGDLADDTLECRLAALGHRVRRATAYRTVTTRPDSSGWRHADAVLFASGSSASAWADAFGVATPPIVVAIGPTTEAVALGHGLKVTATAADHSLDGLVAELVRCVGRARLGD